MKNPFLKEVFPLTKRICLSIYGGRKNPFLSFRNCYFYTFLLVGKREWSLLSLLPDCHIHFTALERERERERESRPYFWLTSAAAFSQIFRETFCYSAINRILVLLTSTFYFHLVCWSLISLWWLSINQSECNTYPKVTNAFFYKLCYLSTRYFFILKRVMTSLIRPTVHFIFTLWKI